MTLVNVVYEDRLTLAVIEKIFTLRNDLEICTRIHACGSGKIRKNVSKYNQAAGFGNAFFVLADLDLNSCLVLMRDEWLERRPLHPRLFFRIVVREIEAWILADRQNFADFLGCALSKIPENPDVLPDPKECLINLAKKSKKKDIREIAPADSTARLGLSYNYLLCEFVKNEWEMEKAALNSPSFCRTIERFRLWNP